MMLTKFQINREAMVTSTVSNRLFENIFCHYLLVFVLESIIRNPFFFFFFPYADQTQIASSFNFTSSTAYIPSCVADSALPFAGDPCRLSCRSSSTGQQTIHSRCWYARNSEDADRERVQRGVKRVVMKEGGVKLTNKYIFNRFAPCC